MIAKLVITVHQDLQSLHNYQHLLDITQTLKLVNLLLVTSDSITPSLLRVLVFHVEQGSTVTKKE